MNKILLQALDESTAMAADQALQKEACTANLLHPTCSAISSEAIRFVESTSAITYYHMVTPQSFLASARHTGF